MNKKEGASCITTHPHLVFWGYLFLFGALLNSPDKLWKLCINKYCTMCPQKT